MNRRLLSLLVSAALLAGLAACGRKGSPQAPGPTDQVTYPRTYPSQ